MAKKKAATVARRANGEDKHVGQRLRAARLAADISQSELGDKIGVSFQQVQKYEKGTNRVSASRLRQFAEIFDKPLNYFFDHAASKTGAGKPDGLDALLANGEVIQLLKLLARIEDAPKRRVVLQCATQIAGAIYREI